MKNRQIIFAITATLLASASANTWAAERIEKGNLILENVPETPPALSERLRQYQNTRSASLAGFPADGDGIFISTRFAETSQIHFVTQPMGARAQVTFYDEPLGGIAASPTDANHFAFTRDNGGDENYQVFLFDRARGASEMISDGEGRQGSPTWSQDGAQLAWYKTLEGSTRGIVVAAVDAPENRRLAFQGDGWWSPSGWSPDGLSLLLFHYISINESEIHLLNVTSGETTRVNPSNDKIAFGNAEFSHDGQSIYFTSDEGGEFLDLYRYDIASRVKQNLTSEIDWDVGAIRISPDGKSYAFVTNEAGRSRLHIRRTRDDRALPAPDLPPGVIGGLDYRPDGSQIGFSLNAADSPGDVYTWLLGRNRSALERWTESEVGGLDSSSFIQPEFFDYPTFDTVNDESRQIPGFIYKPEGEGPHPVIVSIHGGPEGQARPTFSSTYQFWANELGAAIIVPNVRGSSGFGKTYVQLDNGMKREDSVKDIGALLDWVETQGDLDKNRIMVYGGSYGGYMVLASMVHFNDRLAGAVDIVGISNFVTFLENTAEYRRDLRRPEYGDERIPEMRAFLESIAPLNHADKISKPLFVIQGINDPRVPYTEAEQILAKVRANGGEVWYMAAKDEGHGFRKKSNRDAMTEAVALFIEDLFTVE